MRLPWWIWSALLMGCASGPTPPPATSMDETPAPTEPALDLPETVPTSLIIAGALTASGDPAAALPYYRYAYEQQPDNLTLGDRYATAAIHAGLHREAERVLADLTRLYPEQWELAARRGRLLLILDDLETANAVSASLIPDHGSRPQVLDLRVDILLRREQHEEATMLLRQYVGEQPRDVDRRLRYASLLAIQLQPAAAESELRGILRVDPENSEALQLVSAMLREQGRTAELETLVGELLEDSPGSRTLKLEKADLAIGRGNPEAAADILVPMAERGELEWTDRLLLADLLSKIGRGPEAQNLVDELLREGWEGPLVLRLAGSLAMEAGDDAAAEEYLRRALEVDPGDVDAMLTLLLLFDRQHDDLLGEEGLNPEADAQVRRRFTALLDRAAAGADPERIRHQYLVGALLRRAGRDADAVPFLQRAVALEPENEQILYDLAVSQEQSRQYEAAVRTLERLVELEPDEAHYLNFFGYLLADQGWQLERAETLIRRALEKEPDNAFFLDSMGWVYFRTERYEEALDYLVSATNELGDDPIVLEHMGDTLAALERYEQALRFYRRAQAQGGDPDRLDPRVREVERLLREGP